MSHLDVRHLESGEWGIYRGHEDRLWATRPTREEAIEYALDYAERKPGQRDEVRVHLDLRGDA